MASGPSTLPIPVARGRHRWTCRRAGPREARLRGRRAGAIPRDRRDRSGHPARAQCVLGLRCPGCRRAGPGRRGLQGLHDRARRAGRRLRRPHSRRRGRPRPLRQLVCGHPSRRPAQVATRRRAGVRPCRVPRLHACDPCRAAGRPCHRHRPARQGPCRPGPHRRRGVGSITLGEALRARSAMPGSGRRHRTSARASRARCASC